MTAGRAASDTPVARIVNRPVGRSLPTYLVAELSGNHNGSLDRALETVRAAERSGADAIKLQTYTADTMTLRSSDPMFVVGGEGPWAGKTLYDLYEEAHTPWEWHKPLFKEAKKIGIDIFSTPFDRTAVDFLDSLGVPAYKIASFELTDDSLLAAVAGKGKPVIVSTGMASLEEITHAKQVLVESGAREIIFLHCTSAYPAPDESMGLATIPELERVTGCPVGLSDHSVGTTAPVVAVTLGACLIEKHFTLSRADGGVDSHFSLEPAEFAEMAKDVRRAEAMRGAASFGVGLAEEGNVVFRRSLFVVRDVKAGESFSDQNIRAIRPGYGLSPRHLATALKSRARSDIRAGTPLAWEHLGG
jgi:N-acetylneuraminate synthase